jgi:hypothetical protein
MGMLLRGEVGVSGSDGRAVAMAVARNWVMLGLF